MNVLNFMKIKQHRLQPWFIQGVISLLCFLPVFVGAIDLNAGISLTSENTDNALRTVDNKISENQNSVTLNVQASHQGNAVDFSSGYTASQTQFSEDSQESRGLLTGQSSLQVGQASSPISLSVNHSRQLILIDPAADVLLNNLDEREILEVRPEWNLRLSSVDYVLLAGIYEKIGFGEQSLRNSTRQGAEVQWARRTSAIGDLSLSATNTNVEFDEVPGFEYKLQSLMLRHETRLRRLRYVLGVGYNQSIQSGEEFGGASYELDASFTYPTMSFGARASQTITDISRDNGNQQPLNGEPDVFGTFPQVDQLELTTADIYWDYNGLCERCNLNLSLGTREDSFNNFVEQNSERTTIGTQFSYRQNQRSTLSFSYNKSETNFVDPLLGSFDTASIQATYTYLIGRALDIQFMVKNLERTTLGVDSRVAEENRVGISLGYQY